MYSRLSDGRVLNKVYDVTSINELLPKLGQAVVRVSKRTEVASIVEFSLTQED